MELPCVLAVTSANLQAADLQIFDPWSRGKLSDTMMKPRKNPFSPDASNDSNRLEEIYRAAARIICEKGYDAASMKDIADAVGITKPGLYHHISGKRDLLYGIMNFGLDELDDQVIGPARQIADAEQRLRTIIANHVLLITSRGTPHGYSHVTIVVEEVGGLNPAQRRKVNARKRAYVELVRETLRDLETEGKLRDLDVTVASFSLLGMILWLSHWYKPTGRLSPDQIAEEVAKIAVGGMLRPAGARTGR